MAHKNFRLILLTIILLLTAAATPKAQNEQPFTLTNEDLQGGRQIALDKLQWKYHTGDDSAWANPNFDDSSWETLKSSALQFEDLPADWNGIGWFRLRLRVDESLSGEQLALLINHWGASQIFIDGKLIHSFGKVGATSETEKAFSPNGMPVLFTFNQNKSEHLIAVRHSVATLRDRNSALVNWAVRRHPLGEFFGRKTVGIEARVSESKNAILKRESALQSVVSDRFGRAGLVLMVGILFLVLFIFRPGERANLYFSLFAFCIVANNLSNYYRIVGHYDLLTFALFDALFFFAWAGFNIFLLAFLYAAFAVRIPNYFYIFLAVCALQLFLNIFFVDLPLHQWLQILVLSFVLFEQSRIIIHALIEKKSGAMIVGIGILMFASLTTLNILLWINGVFGLAITVPELVTFFVRQISAIGVTIAIAVYLARNVALTNKTLEAQLIKEVEHEREKTHFAIVEAENERRAKELEEARQLQLSMLPKKLPVIPNLEIAAYMKPATEVGGDYYDFYIGADGTLTVAVGDATGHGLKAGTVVTATKSLFANLAHAPNIGDTLKQISAALKSMNLRGLFMAMAMLKIKDNQVSLSIAGMPSALVYRSHSKTVEEINIRAMPLGSLAKTGYGEEQFTLAAGDVVLLMSDGFPEMFNPENEMLGFGKAAEVLPDIAMNSPQEIINHLVKVGEEWANGRAQDDDVTFVVLKIGGNLN